MVQEEDIGYFISNRIKELRIAKGYTVNSRADKFGISQSYVRDIELGKKTNISVEKLFLICPELDITLKDFFDINYQPCPTSDLQKAINSLTDSQQNALTNFLISVKE